MIVTMYAQSTDLSYESNKFSIKKWKIKLSKQNVCIKQQKDACLSICLSVVINQSKIIQVDVQEMQANGNKIKSKVKLVSKNHK